MSLARFTNKKKLYSHQVNTTVLKVDKMAYVLDPDDEREEKGNLLVIV